MHWRHSIPFVWIIIHSMALIMADEPSLEYETDLQRGGDRDLARFETGLIDIGRLQNDWKVPHENMRKYYDLAGLPEAGSSRLRNPHKKFRYSPQSVKNAVNRGLYGVKREVWRLNLKLEQISWTALVTEKGLPAP